MRTEYVKSVMKKRKYPEIVAVDNVILMLMKLLHTMPKGMKTTPNRESLILLPK